MKNNKEKTPKRIFEEVCEKAAKEGRWIALNRFEHRKGNPGDFYNKLDQETKDKLKQLTSNDVKDSFIRDGYY